MKPFAEVVDNFNISDVEYDSFMFRLLPFLLMVEPNLG